MPTRLAALLLLAGALALAAGADKPKPADDRPTADFRLTDPRTKGVVSLADFKDKKAVVAVFLGTECPINNSFVPVLAQLHKEYEPKGVAFVAINSNRQDTPERVAAHARKYDIPFPVLKDLDDKAADRFGAKRTPEAFVLDPSGKVLYQGRIDDQFGFGFSRPGKPTRRDLACALDEVLAGKPVSVPTTAVEGCRIAHTVKPKAEGDVTYTKHVSRIFQKNCQECHRPGQIGPMALTSYDDAVSWAESIRDAVGDGRMPPWHADPKYGKFSNDRSLSKEDRETLLSWVAQGTPKGDDKDLPPPKAWPEGWSIGKPDLVITMPKAYTVPAESPKGGVPYQHFSVKTDFKEDKWVVRAEAHPGAASVVHHMIVFIVPPGELFQPDAPGSVLVGTAPGDMPLILGEGQAKKVPAGARLVFQMHYTPNGKEQADQSSVGMIFSKEPPKQRCLTKPVLSEKFMFGRDQIPAGEENYVMESSYKFREDSHLLGFMPHMHLRGKDFRYEAIYPDGKKETLLSVPKYNFNWQSVYRCTEPVAMPKGTVLRCVAHFDNSAKNPNNPDATTAVRWGDQTWEEMMIGWIEYYHDNKKP
jgi:peroxiredoxin/mono/diheme cytochrome c family protein